MRVVTVVAAAAAAAANFAVAGLRPACPRLFDALACVTRAGARRWRATGGLAGYDELGAHAPWPGGSWRRDWTVAGPQEAWEVLEARGVLPAGFAAEPRRTYACGACDGKTFVHRVNPTRDGPGGPHDCAACRGADGRITGEAPRPPTIAACVAFASDVAGVLTAEHLARELAARLAPWGVAGGTGLDRVVWRVAAVPHFRCGTAGDDPYWCEPVTAALVATAEAARAAGAVLRRGPASARWQQLDAGDWAAAAAAGLRVPPVPPDPWRGAAWPAALVGRRYAELPDPFAPLGELWAAGYAFDTFDAGGIGLLYPALGRRVVGTRWVSGLRRAAVRKGG